MKKRTEFFVFLLIMPPCFAMEENPDHNKNNNQLIRQNNQKEIHLKQQNKREEALSQAQIMQNIQEMKNELEMNKNRSENLQKKVNSLESQLDIKDNLPLINGGLIAFAFVLIFSQIVLKK